MSEVYDGLVNNKVEGFYRALVVNDKDPKHRGRIQIRIPALHGIPGDHSYVPDEELPWAQPASFHSLGVNSGQLMVPQPGMIVFVTFEANNIKDPLYFGTVALLKNAYKIGGKAAGADCILADVYAHDGKVAIDLLYRSPQGVEIHANRENGDLFLGTMDGDEYHTGYYNGVLVNDSGLYFYMEGQVVEISQVTIVTMTYAEALAVLMGFIPDPSPSQTNRISEVSIDELFS